MPTRHQGAPATPGAPWWVVAPLTYPFSPCHPLPPEKNHYSSHSRVLAHKPTDFDLFAQNFVSETVLGDATWYVTPPLLQLVFDFVGYF